MNLLAGTAREDISPRNPIFLCGYPHVPRMSTGIHDPLYASALCLKNEAETLIVIGVDLLFIGHDIVRRVRERISESTGVPSGNILISATHTHSGPITSPMLAWRDDPVVPPPEQDFLSRLEEKLVSAACRAAAGVLPAELAVCSARIDGVGTNRLHPDGVRDSEAGLLVVRSRADKRILAVDLIYSMHPTVLHEDSTLVSSDFPGPARRILEEEFEGAMVLYQIGPCGNLSPRYSVKGQTFAEAERLGRKLAEPVAETIRKLPVEAFSDEVVLSAAGDRITLPARTFVSPAEAETALRAARGKYAKLKRDRAGHGPVRTAECEVFGAEETVTLARAQADGELDALRREFENAELQVLRVGVLYLVGLPGEWFVEYALELKRKFPGWVFVIALANGELQGYITTPGASGYEAGMSLFKPESGALMRDAALALIGRLKRKEPGS